MHEAEMIKTIQVNSPSRRLVIGFAIGFGILLTGCSAPATQTPLTTFKTHLQALCGQSFEGLVTSQDPQDEDWRKEVLTLGPVSCPDKVTTVLPLAVGPDQSRVWTLRLQDAGQALDFRHAHTLKDGSPDPVTGYGGVATTATSTALQAVFPVDEISKKVFDENGLQASMTNIWSIAIDPDQSVTYKLTREGRLFVAKFDITAPK
jgi:hypothetical protein